MSRRSRLLAGATVVAGCLVAGGVAVPEAASAQLCIPIILPCSTPSPTSTPTPTSSPTPSASASGGVLPVPGLPAVPGGSAGGASGSSQPSPSPSPTTVPTAPAAESVPLALLPKDDSAVFTQPSAQLGVSSLSFTGLKGIALVSVRLADGKRIPVLRLRANSITMDGFALTVRKATGPMLITKADRMSLTGDVTVYLNSLTATDAAGKSLTLGADTPPPKDGITPSLVRATLGLVGTRADEIVYTNTDQQLKN
jgi:hypothetical protein